MVLAAGECNSTRAKGSETCAEECAARRGGLRGWGRGEGVWRRRCRRRDGEGKRRREEENMEEKSYISQTTTATHRPQEGCHRPRCSE